MTAAVAGGLLLGACTGDGFGFPEPDDPVSDETVRAYEGIYALTARTENETSCDAEGPSVLDTTRDRVFMLVGDEVFGQNTLMLVSCSDEADCRDKLASIRARESFGGEYIVNFGEEPASGELVSFKSSTGFEVDGVCEGRDGVLQKLTRSADSVRLEERTVMLANQPADPEGFCRTSPLEDRAEAESLPCVSLEVFVGQRTTDL